MQKKIFISILGALLIIFMFFVNCVSITAAPNLQADSKKILGVWQNSIQDGKGGSITWEMEFLPNQTGFFTTKFVNWHFFADSGLTSTSRMRITWVVTSPDTIDVRPIKDEEGILDTPLDPGKAITMRYTSSLSKDSLIVETEGHKDMDYHVEFYRGIIF